MFNRIVLAIDTVDEMEEAIRIALDMVERYDAECYPMHVVDLPQNPSFPEYYERQSGKVDWDDVMENIEERGGELIQDICERMEEISDDEGVEIECLCRVGIGDPAETIVNFREDIDGDLIIMGVHRREGLDRILHSSVSRKVIRESEVPVLTVHV